MASKKLDNSLVEMLVAVGMNHRTGLVPSSVQAPSHLNQEIDFYDTLFEPVTLAAISSHVALFPQDSTELDPDYPPSGRETTVGRYESGTFPSTEFQTLQNKRKIKLKEEASQDQVDKFTAIENYATLKPRGVARRQSFRPSDMAPKGQRKVEVKLKPEEMPLSSETIASLGSLCFPDGNRVYQEKPADSVHHLVMTDITGTKTYTTCLTYYSNCYACRTVGETTWQCCPCERGNSDLSPEDTQYNCYVPICLVLISKHPYYSLMTDALSCLLSQLQKLNPHMWAQTLKEFTLCLTMVPVPPPGPAIVSFSLFDQRLPVHPAAHPDRSLVDLPLNLVFQCFPLEDILLLYNALLMQQRVVFVSSSYAMMTFVSESFLHFLSPFKWRYTYVPLLSSVMLDYIEAPGTFIMGCHSDYLHQVEKVEGLVIANVDTGHVQVCPTLTIPPLPLDASNLFRKVCQQFKSHLEPHRFESVTYFSYEERKMAELEHREKQNSAITTAFLELMVNLFRDIMLHIKPEKNFFHKEQYLQGIPEADRPFFEEVLRTDLFSDFLKERLAEKRDDWTELVEKTRPANRNSLTLPESQYRRSQSLSCLSCISLQIVYHNKATTRWQPIPLPEFKYGVSAMFFQKCLRGLSDNIKDCQTPDMRASYLYMMGMLHGACGQTLDALENFHDLASCNARLFPSQYVSTLMSGLEPKENEKAKKLTLRNSKLLLNISQAPTLVREKPIVMQLNKIPEEDIDFTGFCELVEMLDISTDRDSICRLFAVLTLQKEYDVEDGHHSAAQVDPETFEEFYKCWKENEVEIAQAAIPATLLEYDECVLKLSNLTKCSLGTGRIALTQKRLFYLQEGSQKCKEVFKLRNIKSLELTQQRSLFTQTQALKIYSNEEKVKPFSAGLKSAAPLWLLLVWEMWAGKMISEEFKDPSVLQLAMQNVLLINAYVTSSELEYTTHHQKALDLATLLCHFRTRSQKGSDRLPGMTKDVLQHRIDPNGAEADRVAVEALLYVAGTRCAGSAADHGPELWCGLGNGKIRMYDASTWLMDRNFNFSAKKRVACLMRVGDSMIWAASLDSVIYIIDRSSRWMKQTLLGHSDFVADLAVSTDQSTVYSGGCDGQVITWSTQTLERLAEFRLPSSGGNGHMTLIALEFVSGTIWCCSRTSLVQVTTEGKPLRMFTGQKDLIGQAPLHVSQETMLVGQLNLSCFLLTSQNEVWLGMRDKGEVIVCYADTLEVKKRLTLGDPMESGITRIIQIYDKAWIGTKAGRLYIYSSLKYTLDKCLPEAHTDAVRAMCTAANRYVLTGASSRDGTVSIWKSSIA